MTSTRRALALLAMILAPVLICAILPALPASAQTVATAIASVVPTGVTHEKSRSGPNLLVNQINYADCANDDVIDVPVTTQNASNYTLQAWINQGGADCSAASARSGVTISCWLVASVIPAANATSTLVKIPVRAIVAGFTEDLGLPGGTVGTGTDGTLGLKEIKAVSGLTMAQDEQTARYASMPHSAPIAIEPVR